MYNDTIEIYIWLRSSVSLTVITVLRIISYYYTIIFWLNRRFEDLENIKQFNPNNNVGSFEIVAEAIFCTVT